MITVRSFKVHDKIVNQILLSFLLLLLLAVPNLLFSQTLPEYHNLSTEYSKSVQVNYLVYTPANYRPNESWPMVLYLSGAEAVDDIDAIRSAGPPRALESGMAFDFILIAPQLPGDVHWDPDALNALMEDVQRSYNIDSERRYITGIGDRGGFGAYEFCVSYPGIFKRLAVMGATACTEICRIGDMQTWIFHGGRDSLVAVEDAVNMHYEMTTYCGLDAQLTVYDSLGHNVWDEAFSDDDFWQWFADIRPVYDSSPPVPEQKSLNKEITESMDDDYLLYLPETYSAGSDDWPLLIFLHGSGGPIHNIEDIRTAGPPLKFEEGRDNEFILLCPQLHDNVHWDVDRIHTLATRIIDYYRVDRSRIYITGLSRGGFGAWEYAVSYPELFAAVIPISARDVPGVERLENTATWIFHGALDDGVPWQAAEMMHSRLLARQAKTYLTLYPNVGHWAWIPAYDSSDMWTWMLSQVNTHTVSVEPSRSIEAEEFEIFPAYPNPFNAMIRIPIRLWKRSELTMKLFDLSGKCVKTQSLSIEAGRYEHNLQGVEMTSGIYFLQISGQHTDVIQKIILLK